MPGKLLAIYLNDHLAVSTSGLELAKRARAANKGTDYGAFLTRLAKEVESDRSALETIMDDLDVSRDHLKVLGGWAAEKAGRLKPNGQLRGYSPLSRLVELEGLTLGVAGNLALWRTLRDEAEHEPRLDAARLERLAASAERQRDELEEHRRRAAREAFAA